MKKYVKPVAVFENFELNHSIANCSPAMNQSMNSCDYDSSELFGYLNPGETVFNAGACTYSLEEFRAIFEGFCIQTGADNFNLFTS